MDDNNKTSFDPQFVRNMIESALRLSLLFALLILAYDIIRPFTTPLIWGAIIAIAAFPLVKWLEAKIGGRRGLAATLVTLFFILALAIPSWSVMEATVGGLKKASTALDAGEIKVPPPAAKVQDWPLVGERLHHAWSAASNDLEAFAQANAEQLREVAGKLLKRIGGSLVGVLMFLVSLVIAGGFMTYAEPCGAAAHRFFVRVGGLRPGGEWASLTVATVRSVLQGVIGVAIIQTILIAIGLFVMGVPAATDINKVVAEPNRCNRGRASPIICGLTATKTTAGSSGSISLTRTPIDKSQSLGLGSKIQTDFGSIP